jgi:glycosyltransferase involved in cell wall biosynthesis
MRQHDTFKPENSDPSLSNPANFEYNLPAVTRQNAMSAAALPDSPVVYCIITPVRDEEEFIGGTIEAVAAQTFRPAEWIIVDDGSTDQTSSIIERYARKYPWIRAARRENRGFRSTGGGIDGFLYGVELLKTKNWEFLINLDGDLTFSPQYFEKCFAYFRKNPGLGIGGGTIYNKIGDRLYLEKCADSHVRGATKIYRRQCWDSLGGMLRGLGWDTVDEIKARMRGWSTFAFPDLQLIHHRATGAALGRWADGVKNGHSDYIVGYHPLFFAAKCVRRAFKPPYLISALALAYGFSRSYVRRAPRVDDAEFIRYLREQQLKRLLSFDRTKVPGITE